MNFFEKVNAKHIPSVDLVKFMMAIFVVAIHTHPYTCIEKRLFKFLCKEVDFAGCPILFCCFRFLSMEKN